MVGGQKRVGLDLIVPWIDYSGWFWIIVVYHLIGAGFNLLNVQTSKVLILNYLRDFFSLPNTSMGDAKQLTWPNNIAYSYPDTIPVPN
jgi:hypothetical protein